MVCSLLFLLVSGTGGVMTLRHIEVVMGLWLSPVCRFHDADAISHALPIVCLRHWCLPMLSMRERRSHTEGESMRPAALNIF